MEVSKVMGDPQITIGLLKWCRGMDDWGAPLFNEETTKMYQKDSTSMTVYSSDSRVKFDFATYFNVI